MRKLLSLLSLVSLLSFPALAQNLQADLDAMVASERAFSKQGARVGYLRIWEKRGGTWKLRVDWVDDPPPPPPSSGI